VQRDHPRVLFVGSLERAKQLKTDNLHQALKLWTASEVMAALGYYALYMPDLVVIEDIGDTRFADEVYVHLASVGAKPLVVLAAPLRRRLWEELAAPTTFVLPRGIGNQELLSNLIKIAAEIDSRFVEDTSRPREELVPFD
jgi:hypothetical protein